MKSSKMTKGQIVSLIALLLSVVVILLSLIFRTSELMTTSESIRALYVGVILFCISTILVKISNK